MAESGLNDDLSVKEEDEDFFIMRKNNSDASKVNRDNAIIEQVKVESDASKMNQDNAIPEEVKVEGDASKVNQDIANPEKVKVEGNASDSDEKITLKDDTPVTPKQPVLLNPATILDSSNPAFTIAAAAIQAFKAASTSNLNSESGKNIAQNFPLGNHFFPIPAFTLSLPNNSLTTHVGNPDMKFLVLPVHQCWGCEKEFTDMELFTEHVTKSMCLPSLDTKSNPTELPQLPSDTSASLSDQASVSGPSTTQEALNHNNVGKIDSRESSPNISSVDLVIDSVLKDIRKEIAQEKDADYVDSIKLKPEPMEVSSETAEDDVDTASNNDTNNNKPHEDIDLELNKYEPKDSIEEEEVTDIGDHLDIDPQHPARLKKAIYACFECDQEFHTNIGLLRHQSISHGAKQFPCDTAGCSKVFKNESALNDHKKRVHGPRSFACVHCNAYFTTETYLKAHVKIHMEKKHVCKECKHSFVNKTDLNNHMRVHTGVKPYCCKVCGKAFRHVSGYYTHVRIHTGETPYQCEFCEKKFTNASNFQTHRKIHTQDKKFKCDICGKEFIQQSNFTRHKRTHTKERPYKCSNCGEQFSYSTCLKKHLKKDHGVEPLECDRCKRTFLNHSSFVRHRTGCQFKDIVKKEAETDSAQFL